MGLMSLFCLTLFLAPVASYAAGEPAYRGWDTGPVLDQGDTPECVGYSLSTLMADTPYAFPDGSVPSPDWIYFGAQARDPWGNAAHDGSTIEAGFQYLQDYGYVDSVSYTSDADTVADWVLNDGPVEMATEWDWIMFNPDASGVVTPGGLIAGYHAWNLDAYNRVTQMFDGQTSWGTTFANNGHFLISLQSVQYLLTNEASDYREAALPHKDATKWLFYQLERNQ